ncbi:MAG TPA: DUF6797 domain-containing protein [Methylomirabilota bacterium]|nr:DUF6797 domain-containing protein [Methylomirabilota bacterium]
MKHLSRSLACLGVAIVASSFAAEPKPQPKPPVEPIRGPVFSGTIRGPKVNEPIAMKGVVVTVGAEKNAYVCYDTDLLRVSMAWTGQFLEFGNTLNQIAWPPPPQVKGNPVFSLKPGPGWAKGESLSDPRANNQGPLPKDWAHYTGLYVNGDQVVLSYKVGKTEVLEMPGYQSHEGAGVFTRTFNIGPSDSEMTLAVCSFDATGDLTANPTMMPAGAGRYVTVGRENALAVGLVGAPDNVTFDRGAEALHLKIPAHRGKLQFTLAISSAKEQGAVQKHAAFLQGASKPADLATLCKGGPARWTQTVTTKGVRGNDDAAYVVDTITEPTENPYRAETFFGGFDFLRDGRIAICTFHGDVWIVSGIDDSLQNLTWKRYATGMFQPLGLKVVDDRIYVLGRDQITRLHDLNKDGEADYYENFNNDTVVTANYHEFKLDLHTDPQGNFYYAKGSPWEPEVTSPHQGTMIKVSKDGSKLEVIATGLRAPNGMTVGPKSEITVSDNQGHWMPASKLNWVEKGGFYGMTPAAQRELKMTRGGTNITANPSDPKQRALHKFKGWDANSPQPESYDEPIAWLPMNMDNSSGGQVWVTSDKWGPLKGQLLFMSYGKCTLFNTMLDEVDGVRQAAMVQLPLKFNSGVMRGRFNPKDGQLYLCGLKGWQSSATRNGGLYRVRYTKKPVVLPTAFRATKDGVELAFASPLKAESAQDVGSYSVEQWNYRWTGAYGSPEFSVRNPDERKHDRLEVAEAKLSKDGKKLFLKINDMRPSDQFKLKYSLDSAEGEALSQEIYATIHKLGSSKMNN